MARIAIIKLFTGLNLAPAQLSGELQRAGHDSEIIFFKDYRPQLAEDLNGFVFTEYPSIITDVNGVKRIWNCYKPFSPREFELLISTLHDFKPDAIGFSVISGVIKESALVTNEVRKHFDVPIIWGGPGPTLEPEKCLEHADLVCINEGEGVIVDLADRLDSQQDITNIPGTHARLPDGSIQQNPERALLNLDDIAFPDWELSRYVHINRIKGVRKNAYPNNLFNEYPIMTQRGCPFSCSFCIESKYQDMFGKKSSLRRRDIQLVLDELHWAKKNLKIDTVLFYDDVFTVNPRWLKEFLPRYKEEIGLPFWCYTYPTTHDRATLEMLKDAGLKSITMGIQSGSSRMLSDYLNRPTERQRIIDAAQEIVDLGPSVTGFFDLITKIPFETEDDLKESFEFLLELPKEFKTIGLAEMIEFPTYSFSEKIEQERSVIAQSDGLLDEKTYDFYNRLFLLTRLPIPEAEMRAIANNKEYRDNPMLLNDLLSQNTASASFTGAESY